MRLTQTGLPRLGADKGGGQITYERHHRVGFPGECALSVKIGPGPILRFTIEQQHELEDFLRKEPSP